MTKIYFMDLSDSWHNFTTIATITTFYLIYSITYEILRRKIPNKPPEYVNRLVTLPHGSLSSLFCLYYVCGPALNLYEVDSIPYKVIISHSLGYFAFDIIWCFKYNEPAIIKFHHIATCSGLFYYSFKLSHQYLIVYSLGLMEFTNPLIQIRWYMTYHKKTKELIFKIVDRTFFALFFYIRIIVLTYYAYLSITMPELNFSADDFLFLSLGVLIGYGLSFEMIKFMINVRRRSNLKLKDENGKNGINGKAPTSWLDKES